MPTIQEIIRQLQASQTPYMAKDDKISYVGEPGSANLPANQIDWAGNVNEVIQQVQGMQRPDQGNVPPGLSQLLNQQSDYNKQVVGAADSKLKELGFDMRHGDINALQQAGPLLQIKKQALLEDALSKGGVETYMNALQKLDPEAYKKQLQVQAQMDKQLAETDKTRVTTTIDKYKAIGDIMHTALATSPQYRQQVWDDAKSVFKELGISVPEKYNDGYAKSALMTAMSQMSSADKASRVAGLPAGSVPGAGATNPNIPAEKQQLAYKRDALVSNLEDLKQLLGTKGVPYGSLAPSITQGDETQKIVFAQNMAREYLGRLQSGGAITSDELTSFAKLVPSVSDSGKVAQYKIDKLIKSLQGLPSISTDSKSQQGTMSLEGYNEEDIKHTMEKHGLTLEQLTEKLKGNK